MSWMRRLALAGAVVLVVAAVALYPTLYGKPWSIDHFFARVFLEFALERPLVLSQLRILEPYGIRFHTDELDDLSPEFERDEIREFKSNLEILRSYDRDSLSDSQRVSADVLEWFLDLQAGREPFLLYDYPVNQVNGIQTGLPDFMLNVHQINTPQDAEDYRVRLSKFGIAFDQVIEGLEARREAGIVPPAFVVAMVRRDLEDFLATPAEKHFLYRHFQQSLEAMDGLDAGRREDLESGVRTELEQTVFPAYRRLDQAVAAFEGLATEADGAWKHPNGDAYYAWALRRYTTTDLSADEIHEIGLREVERIRGQMRAILEAEGVPADDLAGALRRISAAPRFQYPDSDAGREAILADYRAIIDDARGRLPGLFGRLPQAKVRIERVPEFMQQGAPAAYYNPPPFDGSKPGIFYVNLRDVRESVKFRMRTLAYHEAIPGHHLQISLAMEMDDVPFFRRVLPFTAYTEGWALYAEQLAAEQGFHPTAADRLGGLVDEMFRAVRLVVDTGIHAKRWTREEAAFYMAENTGKPSSEVLAEIDRYIVMPGQATAYKIGQLEILRLRAEAQRRLGDAFDLREFHDVVLGGGAVPLQVLETIVNDWIASRGA